MTIMDMTDYTILFVLPGSDVLEAAEIQPVFDGDDFEGVRILGVSCEITLAQRYDLALFADENGNIDFWRVERDIAIAEEKYEFWKVE